MSTENVGTAGRSDPIGSTLAGAIPAGAIPAEDTSPGATVDDVALTELDTPVGLLAVAGTQVGVAAAGWCSATDLAQRLGLPVIDEPQRLATTIDDLRAYLSGQAHRFRRPVDWRLTGGVQRTVLQMLSATVGHGRTVTYGELAERCGDGLSARGVGAIMGSNPLPVLVPCHRVVARNGLGGYSGGTNPNGGPMVKRWLLTLEGALPPMLDHDAGRTAVHGAGRVGRGWENERDE